MTSIEAESFLNTIEAALKNAINYTTNAIPSGNSNERIRKSARKGLDALKLYQAGLIERSAINEKDQDHEISRAIARGLWNGKLASPTDIIAIFHQKIINDIVAVFNRHASIDPHSHGSSNGIIVYTDALRDDIDKLRRK
jgi:hypothetical protein